MHITSGLAFSKGPPHFFLVTTKQSIVSAIVKGPNRQVIFRRLLSIPLPREKLRDAVTTPQGISRRSHPCDTRPTILRF